MVVILLVEQSINNPKFESSNADHASNSWKRQNMKHSWPSIVAQIVNQITKEPIQGFESSCQWHLVKMVKNV